MQELWILWSYHLNSVTFKYKYRKVTLKQNVPYYTMSLVPFSREPFPFLQKLVQNWNHWNSENKTIVLQGNNPLKLSELESMPFRVYKNKQEL